ncbi:MAG: TnpV protein [Clostridia bacterium]|nr:TnpV protein [Clostridia bacterium]
MEKYIIDERTGWEYELKCEQYYPTGRKMKDGHLQPETVDVNNEPENEKPIGIWGRRHGEYLKKHQKYVYDEFLFSGRLNTYLAQIDADAQEMFANLVQAMAKTEGLTEQLKAEDPMRWTGLMNNLRNCAEEIVNRELIFT